MSKLEKWMRICIYEKATNVVILTVVQDVTWFLGTSSPKRPEIVFSHVSCNQ